MHKITKNNFLKLLENLKRNNKIIAPIKLDKDIEFDYISRVDDIIFDFRNTVKPAKDFFIPQSEEILSFDKGKIKANLNNEKRLFFGIRPCDLYGLCVMEPTFEEGVKDAHYLGKKENTTLIVYGCTENCNENAFCDSITGHIANCCFDLQIIKLDDKEFFIEIGSNKGKSIVSNNISLFNKTSNTEIKEINKIKNKRINNKKVNLDLFFKKLDKNKFNNIEYWKKVSETCLRCGACTYLCPSCFCNNMVDNKNGRLRCWDSCMFRGFTREAAGVVPRETLFSRFRQRIYHKYKWHKERYNVHMCTGCGRCVTYCPGLIPYIDIINEVSNE